jgi:hypothetical protein
MMLMNKGKDVQKVQVQFVKVFRKCRIQLILADRSLEGFHV